MVILGNAFLVFLWYSWSVILFPYPVDYGEGPLLDQVLRLAGFRNIYHATIAAPPHTVANYPPVYQLLQIPFVNFFGPAYWYGRLISWASSVVSAVLIGGILYAFTRNRLTTVISGLIFLIIPYVSYWSPLYRVDCLALAFSLGGLFVLVRWGDKRWSVFLAALLLTTAVYTKQSYGLAAPLTAFAWLLAVSSRRRAYTFAGLMAGLGLGIFALLQTLTDGGFVFNIISANINEFQWDRLGAHLLRLLLFLPCLLVFAFRFVSTGRPEHPKLWLFATTYLIGAILSGLTIGKLGSNVNYFLELTAALSLTTGAFLAKQQKPPRKQQLVATCLIGQVIWCIAVSMFYHHFFVTWKIERKDEVDKLMQIVQQAEGDVLSDEFMGLIPLDNRQLYLQPFEVSQLALTGIWDQTPVLEAIRNRKFSVILIYKSPYYDFYKDRWTPEMLSLIEEHYRETQYFADTTVYRPRPD